MQGPPTKLRGNDSRRSCGCVVIRDYKIVLGLKCNTSRIRQVCSPPSHYYIRLPSKRSTWMQPDVSATDSISVDCGRSSIGDRLASQNRKTGSCSEGHWRLGCRNPCRYCHH